MFHCWKRRSRLNRNYVYSLSALQWTLESLSRSRSHWIGLNWNSLHRTECMKNRLSASNICRLHNAHSMSLSIQLFALLFLSLLLSPPLTTTHTHTEWLSYHIFANIAVFFFHSMLHTPTEVMKKKIYNNNNKVKRRRKTRRPVACRLHYNKMKRYQHTTTYSWYTDTFVCRKETWRDYIFFSPLYV